MYPNELLFEQCSANEAIKGANQGAGAVTTSSYHTFSAKQPGRARFLVYMEGKTGLTKNSIKFRKQKSTGGAAVDFTPASPVIYKWGDNEKRKAPATEVNTFADTGTNTVILACDFKAEDLGFEGYDQVAVAVQAPGVARQLFAFWIFDTGFNPVA